MNYEDIVQPNRTHSLVLTFILVCSALVVPITFAGAGAAQSAFDIEYDSTSAGSDGPSPFTEDFQITAGDTAFEFGPDVSRSIRIRRADTGAEVTVQPQDGEATYTVDGIEMNAGNFIENVESDRLSTIRLTTQSGGSQEVNVSVSGDIEMFSENAFDPYVIEIVGEDGTVLASTEQRIHAVRYEASITYNGSALALTRPPSAQPGWYVELQQDSGEFGPEETTIEFDHDAGDEFFVAKTEGTDFNESEYFSISILENESDAIGDRLGHLFLLEITDDAQIEKIVGDRLPTDLDGDNTYEDINGDGIFDIVDVSALYNNYETDAVQNNVAAYDYNGDGVVNIVDVSKMFNEV